MKSVSTEKDPFASLKYKEFRYFILTRFLLTIALQIQAVIVGWKIYEITQNVVSLGLIGLTEAIPALSIALYAGHVVDNSDRRKVVLTALSSLFLLALLLGSVGSVYPQKLVYTMYAVLFLGGIARGFLGPAFFSLLAQLIPRDLYANSSTWNSSSWQIGAVVGPALGGLLYAWIGFNHSMVLVTILIAIGVFSIFQISPKGIPVKEKVESIMESLSSGIRFVFQNKIILGALSLDLFAVLFGGAVALLPVFAKDILKIGPQGLGLLRAAPSVGAFIMMVILAYWPPVNKAGVKLLWSVAGFGICMILFALSANFYFSLWILALSGAFDSVSVIIRSTILQMSTPENMRGRVSAVNTMFIGSSNEIGGFESGMAARLMGLIPSVVFGGCVTILVVGVTSLKANALKAFNMHEIK